jgi:hypothetical protein
MPGHCSIQEKLGIAKSVINWSWINVLIIKKNSLQPGHSSIWWRIESCGFPKTCFITGMEGGTFTRNPYKFYSLLRLKHVTTCGSVQHFRVRSEPHTDPYGSQFAALYILQHWHPALSILRQLHALETK